MKAIVGDYNALEKILSIKEKRPPVYLPPISCHVLRHTGCTRMAERGMGIRVLQEIMGHENIAVTMRVYNHVDKQRLRKEMDRMDELRENRAS